jgi:hypothetical protein
VDQIIGVPDAGGIRDASQPVVAKETYSLLLIGAPLSQEGKEGPLKARSGDSSQHTERFLNSPYIGKRPTFAEHFQQTPPNRWE